MRSWSDSGIKISDLYQVVVLYFYGDRGGVRREFAREVADFPPIGRRTITGTSPMARAARGSIGTRQFLWARFLRTGLVCTTCTGMSGNGSRTAGTTATRGLRRDGSAWTTGGECSWRGLRGGSWGYFPWILRSADRGRYSSGYRSNNFGFSCIPDAHPVTLYLITSGVQGRSPWSSRRLSFGDANADVRTRPFTERLRDR